jgi:hypothetical protein
VASGWLTLSGENVLFLLITLFLTDALWGTLWHLIAEGGWLNVPVSWPSQAQESTSGGLPYTAPGSPSYVVFGRLNRIRTWWREVFWPRRSHALLGLAVALPLALIVATILGERVVILTIAALAVMMLGFIRARHSGVPSLTLRAVLETGLAWLAGHTAFAPLSLWSFLLASLYSVTYHGCLKLVRSSEKRWLTQLNVSQAAVVVLLICLRQPVLAGLVALLLLPQMLLHSFLDQDQEELWYLRRIGPFLIIGMLLAALAIR